MEPFLKHSKKKSNIGAGDNFFKLNALMIEFFSLVLRWREEKRLTS